MFFAGGPGRPIPLHDYIHDSLEDIDEPRRVRAGFAYATDDGIDQLCTDNGDDWRDAVSAKWIIGLDQGLTTPSAIENLDSQGDAEVRVLYPGNALTREALTRRPRFHAKLLFLESGQIQGQEHLITTSANMTGSALGSVPTNYEVGLVKSRDSGLSDAEVDEFETWWDLAWSESEPVTDDLIETYAELREEFRDDNPGVSEYEEPESVEYSSEGECMWIETREMTGGSRNQVEFNEELSAFFSDSGVLPGDVDIEFQGQLYSGRPLNTRTTDPPFGVSICLIYLPTGFDYTHKVVHFEKLPSDSATTPRVRLTVAEPGDMEVERWRARSRDAGVIGETAGGREYGYY